MAKNSSPGFTVRESMLYPSTSCSAPSSGGREPRTTLPPTARAIVARLSLAITPARAAPPARSPGGVIARGSSRRPQDLPRDLAVVERNGPLAQDLVRLVPLAG